MKKIVLIGGNRKLECLYSSLIKKWYIVTIINNNREYCERIADSFEDLDIYYGDATKPYVLSDAGVEEYDMAVCLASSDADNLIISSICKKMFNIKKVVSILYDPKKMDLFYDCGYVDRVVCTNEVLANTIEQNLLFDHDISNKLVKQGGIMISQKLITTKDDQYIGKYVKDIPLKNKNIVCIQRNGLNIIPNGNSRILNNDLLIIVENEG